MFLKKLCKIHRKSRCWKVFCKSQEYNSTKVSFLIRLLAKRLQSIKKESNTGFFCEFCLIFRYICRWLLLSHENTVLEACFSLSRRSPVKMVSIQNIFFYQTLKCFYILSQVHIVRLLLRSLKLCWIFKFRYSEKTFPLFLSSYRISTLVCLVCRHPG